jgi:hypothetical protein
MDKELDITETEASLRKELRWQSQDSRSKTHYPWDSITGDSFGRVFWGCTLEDFG